MMRTLFPLLVGLCALYLTVAVFGLQATKPAQIDCKWSPWSEWTACDPCTKTKRRSRGVEAFGQFHGKACQEALADVEHCDTSVECEKEPILSCPENMFQCKSGMCVRMNLVCNGDFDCEDVTDETCREPVRKPCGDTFLDNNEESRTAGYGINILGAEPRINPFYNDYFDGRCNRVMNPKTLKFDRLPYNIATLNYLTHAVETSSKEIYEDTSSLLKELLVETKFSQGIGASVKYTPSEKPMEGSASGGETGVGSGGGSGGGSGVSGGVGLQVDTEKKNMIKTLTDTTITKGKTFMRVRGSLQLSTYRMLSNSQDLKVAAEFLKHVKSLPLMYEKGVYFTFLEDYGTHYTKTGRSGGEYELVYILNQETITKKQMTEKQVKDCIKVGIDANIDSGTGIEGKADVKPVDDCTDTTDRVTGTQTGTALVDMVVTSVRGGSTETAAAMKAYLNKEGRMDIESFKAWAGTVADNPALLRSEPEPIYHIIPLDTPDANTRKSNLKRAIEEYVAEYNVCKCQPCRNGGTVVLVEGECLCLCTHWYEGLACQTAKSDKGEAKAVTQEGNWSCWSGWSSCNGGTRSRNRRCNQGDLTGAHCIGKTENEDYCVV